MEEPHGLQSKGLNNTTEHYAHTQQRHLKKHREDLEKETATYPSVLGMKNSMDRGAWPATVHGVMKS